MTITRTRGRKTTTFLDKAGLSVPQLIPPLTTRPYKHFATLSPRATDEARELLVELRKSGPEYKQPEQQKRHVFRTKKAKNAKCNSESWVFTKYEVAKAFDSILSRTTLPSPGMAQALLSHADIDSFEELWNHLYDPELEKSMSEKTSKAPKFPILPNSISVMRLNTTPLLRSKSVMSLKRPTTMVPKITWLDEVCCRGNIDYIQILCQVGLAQDTLDRAFKVALRIHSMEAMRLLLEFGAAISTISQDLVTARIKHNNDALIKLLLSASKSMSCEAWQSALELEVQSPEAKWLRSPETLLLCVAHRPELCNPQLLQSAVELQNYPATVIVLCYGDFLAGLPENVRRRVCQTICLVENYDVRYNFFELLDEYQLVKDCTILRQQLAKEAKLQQLQMVKLLVDAGVKVDVEPHNSFHWAVSQGNYEILELFKNCKFSSQIAEALLVTPESSSEAEVLRLVKFLGPMGLTGKPLDMSLVRAVQRQQPRLVEELILQGASTEFDNISAIQTSLKMKYLDILETLLRANCSATQLSAAIPTAMSLQPRRIRFQAFTALVRKGILAYELGRPLQTLASEAGEVDCELIQLLLEWKAPIDGVGEENDNALLAVTRRGSLPMLKMLCREKPQQETSAKAVEVAIDTIDVHGPDLVLAMIEILLSNKISDMPIHHSLLHSSLNKATKGNRLAIVRVLLRCGADANYGGGHCLLTALVMQNLELLRLMCLFSPPNQATLKAALRVALHRLYYHPEVLQALLTSSPSASKASNWGFVSESLKGNPNITTIIPILLDSGLDVNTRNGELMVLVIREKNKDLLKIILSFDPSSATLKAAFHEVASTKSKAPDVDVMKVLLEKAKSKEIGQSAALLGQLESVAAGEFEGLRLLLRHHAVVVAPIMCKLSLAAVSSTRDWTAKEELLESLFASCPKITKEDMSEMLVGSVALFTRCPRLPQLLVTRGAEITLNGLKAVLEEGPLDLLGILLGSIKSSDTATKAFQRVLQIAMVSTRRYFIYEYLLQKPIPQDDISEALLQSLKTDGLTDLSIPKLLLEHGASPGYKRCESVSVVIRADSPKFLAAVKLLCQNVNDDSAANTIFSLILKSTKLKREVQVEIYHLLLDKKISKPSLSQALLDQFSSGYPDLNFVKILLEQGADPSKKEGRCIAVAAKEDRIVEFRLLCRYTKRSVVLKVLLQHLKDEKDVIKWFRTCLEHNKRKGPLKDDGLFYLCMQTFPTGTVLVKFLLEHGVSASAKISHCVYPMMDEAESCTPLIWALLQKPRIENDVILAILAKGNPALPAYSTPRTKVSAAFLCLLDKMRLPVLKALLDLDRERVFDYVIPGSSFVPIVIDKAVIKKDLEQPHIDEEISLQLASLYLGNLEAFKLIATEIVPNDTTLHLAALLALPRFVKWLLESHDPNHQAEEYDNMTALAVACASKADACSKIANEEASWKQRQKDTIQLLADVTDPSWRYLNMTILHWSMEHGLETARTLATSLGIAQDPDRNTKYLYSDKEGLKYTPEEYITNLWDASEADKKALIACLTPPPIAAYRFFAPKAIPIPVVKKWTPKKVHVTRPGSRKAARGRGRTGPAADVLPAWTIGEDLFGVNLAARAGDVPRRWPEPAKD
ncbi:hypothetical protein VTL71DRAFT_12895 [Oculimacula yallundae]|uniref:Ankyrin repeat protein n=1 Tax=Oculimacula yallundae TaxID=86028 RepID=A0ABR4CNV7_9HELO